MTYALGVDLGTTYSAVAVHRGGVTEIVSLAHRAMVMASAVFVTDEGQVLVGDAALRRGADEPGRLAREFKRRMGDPVPILVGGAPYPAESLTALLLQRLVADVTAQQGGPPERTVLTFPANWGPHKQDLLAEAIRLADVREGSILTEPEAAAIWYASAERVAPGETIAVYDLGGGTFDAAVLRKTQAGFEVLGQPHGIERLGGIDADEAVFGHVCRLLDLDLEALAKDETIRRALVRLRTECVDAKEALSSDTAVTIPVALPDLHRDVRLTRAELEDMVRPVLDDTVHALRRTISSAGLEPDDIDRVLLVGGASRMPIVADLVTEALGRPFFVDAHPKHVVALGAALAAAYPHHAGAVAQPIAPITAPSGGPEGDGAPVPAEQRRRTRRRTKRRERTAAPAAAVAAVGDVAPTDTAPAVDAAAASADTPMPSPGASADTAAALAVEQSSDVGVADAAAATTVAPADRTDAVRPDAPQADDRVKAPAADTGKDRAGAPAADGTARVPAVDVDVDAGRGGTAAVAKSPVEAPGSPGHEAAPTQTPPGTGAPATPVTTDEPREGGPRRRWPWVAAPVAVVLVVVVAVVATLGGGGGDGGEEVATERTTSTAARPAVEGTPGGEVVDLAMFANDPRDHIDPALEVGSGGAQVVEMLYDGLTGVDARDPAAPEVVPKVAESYDVNADATVWTFTLRDDLRFSDGTPVLPSSFVRGWERATDPDLLPEDAATPLDVIDGVEAKREGEAQGIVGLRHDDGSLTLEVTLTEPTASFDALVGLPPFMPMPEAVESLSDQSTWEDGEMIGNGPFMLEAPRGDDGLVLVPNPEWDGTRYDVALELPEQPFLERITFQASTDLAAAFASFQDGAGQVAVVPPGTFAEAQDEYANTFDAPTMWSRHLRLNWEDPVVGGPDNRLLRRAISQAIDRDAVNDILFAGTAQTATGVTPPAVPGHVDGLCEVCDFDPEQAQADFTAWLAEGNQLAEPIRVQSAVPPGNSDRATASVVDDLNAVGIDAVEEPIAPEEYRERLVAGECQVCTVQVANLAGHTQPYDAFLVELFHSEAIGGSNLGRFSVEAVDQLLDDAQATPDADRRADLLHRAERRLLNDETGAIPLLWHSPGYVYRELAALPQTSTGLVVWERAHLDDSP